MIETELNKVLNYMKQYVENIYEHDSEPMLNYKDVELVLNEIERLNNIINELEKFLNEVMESYGYETDITDRVEKITIKNILRKLKELKENK